MMIDDYDVSIDCSLPHACDEAGIVVRTFLAQTRIRSCIDVPPEVKILRQVRKLCSIARFSLRDPAIDFIKLIDLLEAFEDGRGLGPFDPVETGVVVTALHQRGAKFSRQERSE